MAGLSRATASTNKANFQRPLFGNFAGAATDSSWPKSAGRLTLLASVASSTGSGSSQARCHEWATPEQAEQG
jgi:hypothetical protein